MDTNKEVKIDIPEGYEIDEENSTFECIKFKKVNSLPRSWEEYQKQNKSTQGFIGYSCSINPRLGADYDVFATKYEARAFKAFGKLLQLRAAWIKDWEPDWNNIREFKSTIFINGENIDTGTASTIRHSLSFPNPQMRDEFLECFRDLIEQAKSII